MEEPRYDATGTSRFGRDSSDVLPQVCVMRNPIG